jgi:Arc/MetJ-type ribon-helix-helix transcriptional regulator
MIEGMKVTLTAELAGIVEAKVRAGEFTSADNAVNSLLSYIIGQEAIVGQELAELRAKIAVAVGEIERGEALEWDPNEVWEEVERRYAQQQGKRAS